MINAVVEGESDRQMAIAVARAAGHEVDMLRVAGGWTRLDPLIPKYNEAAKRANWVVFRDSDAECPVALHDRLTSRIAVSQPRFCVRIAHSMAEAWLLADREAFAEFFGIPLNRVPTAPESLPHAKRTLLVLCAGSRSASIRKDVTASDGRAGPLYVHRMNEFASEHWRPPVAAENSPSLRRAIARIRELR